MTLDGPQYDWRQARVRPAHEKTQLLDRGQSEFPSTRRFFDTVIQDVRVIRVDVATSPDGKVPFSYALDLEDTTYGADASAGEDECTRSVIDVTADLKGGRASRIEWNSLSGEPDLPLSFKFERAGESRFQFSFELPAGARCLGLGERLCGLNRRGSVHTLFNTDDTNHIPSIDSMYKSIPFLIVWHHGRCRGIFLDSPARQRWDLDSHLTGAASIELLSRRGFQLYMMDEADLDQIVSAYTHLTGRSKLPPLWSLGHQQSRWSYPDEKTVREIAGEFRKRKIPCDTIVLDIDYMDDYRVFTTSNERFPDFKGLIDDLARDNFDVITIVDPGVKRDARYQVFKDGKKNDYFCKTEDGKIFLGKVWPGVSAFPDFLREDVRTWWAALQGFLIDRGVRGIWNDMNEPVFFDVKEKLARDARELPPDSDQLFLETVPEGKVGHYEVRNLYGFQMSRASHDGLIALRPNERPFVLCRSAYSGLQRYSAVWLGDNHSWWEHLAMSLPMLVSVGISGIPFCGVDIGGFSLDCGGELIMRWYATGIFYPLFRNHCSLHGRPQEPWSFGPDVEAVISKFIKTRYRLLPYIQALFYEHLRTGAPLMRPLAYHYKEDECAVEIDDQFLFGRDIMVAPVCQPGKSIRPVYFPEGRWHPFEGGEPIEGKSVHNIRIEFDRIPAFVREGAVIPLYDVVESTKELADAPVTFHCFGNTSSGVYFEDDGISNDYLKGRFNAYHLSVTDGALEVTPVWQGMRAASRKHRLSIGGKTKDIAAPGA